MKYEIQNIVILVTYENTEFELDKLADLLGETRYDPNIFLGVAYKPYDSEASFLIFSSGKMNCVGVKSIEGAERAIENLTEKLQAQGYDVDDPETKVQNMVASVDFNRSFDLEEIARNFRHAEYNPEVFPGLVFRVEDPNVAFLLFVQGDTVCVGAKSEEEIEEGIDRIEEAIK